MRASIAFAAIDFLACILLSIYVLIAPPVDPTEQAIDTLGAYAVVVTWPDRLNVDVDTHCRLPDGTVIYYANRETSGAHLERDDVGQLGENGNPANRERLVIRSVQEGEYVVNVHLFAGRGPVRVKVRLYRLAGDDRLVRSWRVTLQVEGDEQTVTRVRFDGDGGIRGYSDLEARLADTGLPYP